MTATASGAKWKPNLQPRGHLPVMSRGATPAPRRTVSRNEKRADPEPSWVGGIANFTAPQRESRGARARKRVASHRQQLEGRK